MGGLTWIKARRRRSAASRLQKRSCPMPAESIPVVVFVCAVFGTFMVALFSVHVWSNRKPR
jgi:hypothetical protein